MNKSIIMHGIVERRWSIIGWSLGLIVLVVLTLSLYPAFKNSAQFDQQLQQLPETARKLISDTQDFTSARGYLSSQLFYLNLPLFFSIFTISLGASLINREEKNRTLELILSRRISRTRLIISKMIVGVILCFVLATAIIASEIVCNYFIKTGVSNYNIAASTYFAMIFAGILGAVAFATTATGRGRGISIALASLIGFGGYLLVSFAKIVSWLLWPSKLMPFYYYNPGDYLSGIYNKTYLLVLTSLLAIFAIISWYGFKSRDIN